MKKRRNHMQADDKNCNPGTDQMFIIGIEIGNDQLTGNCLAKQQEDQ